MMLNEKVKDCIDRSVLCWLATVSKDGIPNVSPKEVFTYYKDEYIIVANIASPQTVKNIKNNSRVCLSFVDILVQKGFQLKGSATILDDSHEGYEAMSGPLLKMTNGKFPFTTITCIHVNTVKPIIAPRYLLYPETTEDEQIADAIKSYGFNENRRLPE